MTHTNMYRLHGERVRINIAKYGNKRPAIQIEDEEGMPYMMASVNVPEWDLPENGVIIKNYSENEGIYQWLIERNIIQPLNLYCPLGWEMAPICILNSKDEWSSENNLSSIDDYTD